MRECVASMGLVVLWDYCSLCRDAAHEEYVWVFGSPPLRFYSLTTNKASERRLAEDEISLREEVEEDCEADFAALRTANMVSWS